MAIAAVIGDGFPIAINNQVTADFTVWAFFTSEQVYLIMAKIGINDIDGAVADGAAVSVFFRKHVDYLQVEFTRMPRVWVIQGPQYFL